MARRTVYGLDRRGVEKIRRDHKRILNQPTNLRPRTGRVWFRPTGASPGTQIKEGSLDGALAYGGTATLSVYIGAAGAEVDTGANITVSDSHLCPDESHAAGTWVTVALIAGNWKVIAAQCPCNDGGSS